MTLVCFLLNCLGIKQVRSPLFVRSRSVLIPLTSRILSFLYCKYQSILHSQVTRGPAGSISETTFNQSAFLQFQIFEMNGQFLLNGPRFWNEPQSSRATTHDSQLLTMAKIETPSKIELPTRFEIPIAPPARSRQSSSTSTASKSTTGSPQSQSSPASSTGDHWAQAMSSMFGAEDECLACGYRYGSVEELADHQRIDHGLAEVIF